MYIVILCISLNQDNSKVNAFVLFFLFNIISFTLSYFTKRLPVSGTTKRALLTCSKATRYFKNNTSQSILLITPK